MVSARRFSVPAPADTMVTVAAGEPLPPEQVRRLVEAVAVLRAKRDALAGGMTADELHAYEWRVQVDAVQTPSAEEKNTITLRSVDVAAAAAALSHHESATGRDSHYGLAEKWLPLAMAALHDSRARYPSDLN